METATTTISIGHTPDMDDAFMFYAMGAGKIPMDGLQIRHVIEDIQQLNQRSRSSELDMTAVSAAMYPFVAKDYWILSVGTSVGQGYGPLITAKQPMEPRELTGRRIAVPGLQTTAYLLLRLAIGECEPVPMSFETIQDAVVRGEVDAGLLIHERQLTYRELGLLPILDLGIWWQNTTKLPLPLGLNVIKRSLGEPLAQQVAKKMRDSILWAMTHQDETIQACMQYGRGIDLSRARQFVGMYVNEETIALSEDSRNALRLLYQRAAELELIPGVPDLVIIDPSKNQ